MALSEAGSPHPEEKVFRYSPQEIRKEYIRMGGGIIATLLPLLLLGPSSVILYLLGSMFCLFVVYGIRTFFRSRARIRITAQAVVWDGVQVRSLNWEALEAVRLRYFSTRKDGEKGWFDLRLSGNGVRLKLESGIEDFDELAVICLRAARQKGLSFDPVTARNAAALGFMDHNAEAASGSSEGFQVEKSN
ncbi:hypothetical protein [Sneathiella chinensis]|uniref:PH domain-containing protein n=1 Tax=Sneathiella chinensis TaxID=349750 RepID=A0ABQ5U0Q4_9PROT|nr:hypothetical protein [Sneathiella chinensis]GLQ05236.1 hypothetical protein GCM10007924_04570 [Sneathiella chinensis]